MTFADELVENIRSAREGDYMGSGFWLAKFLSENAEVILRLVRAVETVVTTHGHLIDCAWLAQPRGECICGSAELRAALAALNGEKP